MEVPTLQTERLLICPLSPKDEEWLIPLHQDPDVMRFSPHGVLPEDEVRAVIQNVMMAYELRGFGLNGCWIKETMEPIGFCGVFLRDLEGLPHPELGYRLFPAFWSRGYATEAAMAVKRDAFERIHLAQIYSFIDPQNHKSIRVAEKIGESFAFHAMFKSMLLAIYTAINPARRT